ncbi:galactose-1-phosphate uridyl transferase [Tulasnella sp. 403]|nr:galactose-1-phosphate uridyl transferase [Tulasnella sp. 403]
MAKFGHFPKCPKYRRWSLPPYVVILKRLKLLLSQVHPEGPVAGHAYFVTTPTSKQACLRVRADLSCEMTIGLLSCLGGPYGPSKYSRHIPSLLELTATETKSFADVLSKLTIKYDNLFSTSFAYSMGIHQRPVPPPTIGQLQDEDNIAHLHLHFDPPLLRSATVRKFLVGFELMSEPQRDLTAEQAAKKLRECLDIHYLEQGSEGKGTTT